MSKIRCKRVAIIMTAVLLMLLSFTVSATEPSITLTKKEANTITSTVVIEGTALGASDGDTAIIAVLKEGKTFNSMTDEQRKASLIYFTQTQIEKEKFSFSFKFGESGFDCKFRISVAGFELYEDSINMVLSTAYGDVIDTINEYASTESPLFGSYIKEKRRYLDVEQSIITMLEENSTYASAMNKLSAYVKENPLSATDVVGNTNKINTFMIMQAISDEELDMLKNTYLAEDRSYASYLYTGDESFAKLYDNVIKSETIDKYFVDRISGKQFENLDAFITELENTLIYTATRYGDGVGAIEDVLKVYGSNAGITSVTSAKCNNIIGNNYENFEDLRKDYNKSSVEGPMGGVTTPSTNTRPSAPTNIAISGNGMSGGAVGGSAPLTTLFEDLVGYEWAAPSILALADKGIVNGTGDGMFEPDKNVTREEFVKMIVSALGLELKATENIFDDVTKDDWYFDYVNIAYQNGLCKGVSGNLFGAGQNISRQDMCVMLNNALKIKGDTSKEITFEDKDAIADYAREAISSLYALGAINGVSETTFEPTGLATRAQAAKVIYSVLDYM